MHKHLGILGVLILSGQAAFASQIGLPQASPMAAKVDGLYDFLFWLSVVALTGTTIALLLFVKKYHRSQKGRETAYILGSHTLEITWTVIPLLIMLFVFAWGYKDYVFSRLDPAGSVEVNVVGRQWLWNFEYPNGRKTMNEFYLPLGKPVKLILTSEDVIHSFYLPHMRTKTDVVPGMYVYLAFTPTLLGEHPVYCSMFCGTGHSDMLATLHVLEPADYDKWLATGKVSGVVKAAATEADGKPMSLAEKGAALYASKGCVACHTTDGTKKIGPSWKGIWGTEEELEGGGKAKVDENYIRESIMQPAAKIVKGYPPSMPPFAGLLNDEEVNALIAYIKSLK